MTNTEIREEVVPGTLVIVNKASLDKFTDELKMVRLTIEAVTAERDQLRADAAQQLQDTSRLIGEAVAAATAEITAERDQLRAALAALNAAIRCPHCGDTGCPDCSTVANRVKAALSTPTIAAERERREKLERVVEAARMTVIVPDLRGRLPMLEKSLAALDGTAAQEQPE